MQAPVLQKGSPASELAWQMLCRDTDVLTHAAVETCKANSCFLHDLPATQTLIGRVDSNCVCRDQEMLAQAAVAAFKANAGPFWLARSKADALQSAQTQQRIQARWQAWRWWAARRHLLRERLIIAAVACRRGLVAAGKQATDC